MERLRHVLGRQSGYLARALASHTGIDWDVAERFVEVAGDDLVASYAWQEAELEGRDLSDPSNARDLLSAAYASRIATELGIPRAQVWAALRAFIPRVLQLADSFPIDMAELEPPGVRVPLRWSRVSASPSEMMQHPIA